MDKQSMEVNKTSSNFQSYLENELGQLDESTASNNMTGVVPQKGLERANKTKKETAQHSQQLK